MRAQRMRIQRCLLLSAVLLFAAPGPACRSADGSLRDGLRPLAKYVQEILASRNQSRVGVGEFSPRDRNQNVRAGIAGELTTLLKGDFKLKVDPAAPYQVSGRYALITVNALKVLKVTVAVLDEHENAVESSATIPFQDS